MSQFEHYKALAELDWGDGTWVMFTDDDDLWHQARAEAYVTMVQECKRRNIVCSLGSRICRVC